MTGEVVADAEAGVGVGVGAVVAGRLEAAAGTVDPVVGAVTTTGKLVASGSALVSALWKLDGYVVRDEEMEVADAADAAVTAKVTVTPDWSRWRPAAALATLAMTMLDAETLRYVDQTDLKAVAWAVPNVVAV
jgi:hypothetical protein